MNPIQAAISKISNVARQKFGDNQGWVQNNRISTQPLRQAFATPTDTAYTISRVFTGNPLTRQQYHQATQPIKQAYTKLPRPIQKLGEGFYEGSTVGLSNLDVQPSNNITEKLAYGVGYGASILNPLNPMNKIALGLKGTSAIRGTQQLLGKGASRLIAKGGASKILGLGVKGASQGLPYTTAYGALNLATRKPEDAGVGVLADVGIDATLGAIPVMGGLMKMTKGKGGVVAKQAQQVAKNVINELPTQVSKTSINVPINKLISVKTEPEQSLQRASGFIRQAMQGEIPKRKPVLVWQQKNGDYLVVDGNATVQALNKSGYGKDISIEVIPNQDGISDENFMSGLQQYFVADKYKKGYWNDLQNIARDTKTLLDYDGKEALVKSAYSASRKIQSKLDKGEEPIITDMLRGTIIISNPNQLDKIISSASRRGYAIYKNIKGEMDITNRFIDNKAGYKDISIKMIKMDGDNPVIHEVQLLMPAMYKAKKEIGHTIYDITRVADQWIKKIPIAKELILQYTDILKGWSDKLYNKAYLTDASSLMRPSSTKELISSKDISTPILSESSIMDFKSLPKKANAATLASLKDSPFNPESLSKLAGDIQTYDKTNFIKSQVSKQFAPDIATQELTPLAKKADEIIGDYQMSKEMYDSAKLAVDADRRVLARVKNALNQYDKRQSDEVAFSKSKMWRKYGGDVMSAYNATHGDQLGGVDEYAAINWLRELPNVGQKPTISRSDRAIISNLNRQSKQIEKQVAQQARSQQKSVNLPIDESMLLSGYNKNKLKTRGFTESVQKAEQTLTQVAKKVSGQYEVITNPESLAKAKAQIANNYDEARSRVFESKDWDADVAAIGQELMRKAQANKQWTEAVNIAETIAMKATKAGQGNQALSMWGRMTPEGMLQFATKTIRKANEEQSQITKGIKKVLRIAPTKLDERSASVIDYAMRLANKAKNEEDRVKFVRVAMDEIQSHIPYGISDLLDELRYNNMLSSPLTHVRNAWSNSMQVGLVRPAVLLMQGKPKAVAQYYKGVVTNVAPAVENAIKALSGKVPYKPLEIELKGKLRAKPKLGLYNIPTRLLEASDQLFTTLVRGGEMARGVNKQEADAIAEGLLFRASTHPKGQGQLLNAIDAVADSVGSLRSKGLGWFIPFIRTPMNVAKQWIEYSPAGLLTLPGAANKKEQLAKSLIGSVATLMGAKLAMEGKTTWSAPEDQKERKLFYDSGRKPYSVKIGDKWVPMQYTGTFAWAVGIPAALQYYQTQQRRALTEDQVEKITKGLLSLGGFWSQQTFVSGLGSFVNTMQGKDDYTVTKSLAYTASQINPMAGLQRYIANVIDPIFRKPTTFVQQLQSGVPIMTKNLPYYETSTGEPAKRNISDYIAPYAIKLANPEFEQPYLEKQKRIQENAYINAYTKEDKNIPQPLREKAEKMELDRKAQDGWNYYSAKLKEYNKTKDAKTGSSLYYGIKNSKRLTPEMKEDLLKELPTPKTKGKTKTTSAKTKVKKVKASKSKKAKIKKIKTPKLSAKLPKRKKIKIAKIKTNKFKSLQSPKFAKIKTRSSKNLT